MPRAFAAAMTAACLSLAGYSNEPNQPSASPTEHCRETRLGLECDSLTIDQIESRTNVKIPVGAEVVDLDYQLFQDSHLVVELLLPAGMALVVPERYGSPSATPGTADAALAAQLADRGLADIVSSSGTAEAGHQWAIAKGMDAVGRQIVLIEATTP